MARYQVRPLSPGDIPAAAQLLAARHASDRLRFPFFRDDLATAVGAKAQLETTLGEAGTRAAVADRGGELAGFLVTQPRLFSPTEMMALFLAPHSLSIPTEGYAARAGEDLEALFRDLYGFLAADWVSAGFFDHTVEIVAGDGALQDAWVALGFGRHVTAATRPTADLVTSPVAGDVRIDRAGVEDIDVVMELADELNRHHALAPMFWPLVRTAEAAARGFNKAMLEANEHPYFVAYQGGAAAGMETFLRPGFTPGLVDQSKDVYLFEGIVGQQARSGGVGSALLAHGMAWARDAGHATCTLHFAAQNFSGAPFWLGQGFQPITYTMRRVIDQRILWNR
ncbi:MAG: N-acetyltransferase family protein [Dehalococcoidia bacterium]